MNLFLAVIYNNYKHNVHEDVSESVSIKHDKLRKSFRILERIFITIDYEGYSLICDFIRPGQSKNITAVQWLILSDGSDSITEDDFLHVGNIFSINILEKSPSNSFSIVEMYFPRFYNHPASTKLISLIKDEPYKVRIQKFSQILSIKYFTGFSKYKSSSKAYSWVTNP